MNLPLILYAGCFVLWIVFYYLGCRLSVSDRNYSLWLPLTITIAGLFLSYIESKYLVSNYGTGYGIKPSSFLYSLGCILLFMSSKLEKAYQSRYIGRIVEWFGKKSFVIYLFHCYIIAAFGKVPVDLPWVARWAIIVTMSVILIQILKLMPTKIRYYIGSYD